jgi:hypothetical protein
LYVNLPLRDISETSRSDHGAALQLVELSAPPDPAAHAASSESLFHQYVLRRMTMKSLVTMLSAGAVALMLSNSVMAGTDSPVTSAQIQAAKTTADHEAIAVAFDKEAARFDAMAKDHASMAKAYKAAATTQKGMNGPAMGMHCDQLVDTYKKAADENRQMAAEHRAMAKAAGK